MIVSIHADCVLLQKPHPRHAGMHVTLHNELKITVAYTEIMRAIRVDPFIKWQEGW